MATTAFIGLGTMGYPMAGHLGAGGHHVRVYNRTTETAERWCIQYEGTQHATPAEAATGADFVFTCVGGDDDLRAVLLGDTGALGALKPGAVIVDHTTASASVAREMSELCQAAGVGFIDAPISGGQVGAKQGQLSVMCGGNLGDFQKAEPVIDCYAKAVTLLGESGSGQLTKMVNQILCAGAIQGAAEALAFGEQAGLNMDLVLSAVTQGAAGSWYLSNRGETMVRDEFDFGFAVDWMAKDLGLVQSEAESIGAPTPLTAMTASYLEQSQQAGDNRMDATSIIRRYRQDRTS